MFCLASDEFLRAAQLALGEEGLESLPCNKGGNRLVVHKDIFGFPCLTVHCDGDEYILTRKSPYHGGHKGEDREVGRFFMADPECFRKLYLSIKQAVRR